MGAATRGYDAGKKVNGHKRRIAVDTMGLLLAVIVTGASVQDCDGAKPLMELLADSGRRIQLVWAEAATPANSSPGPPKP